MSTLHVTGAQFSMPSGLAYDRAGTLYVSDAALHAIFSVDRAGRARLFAGRSVPRTSLDNGSYADGPALSARFDQPLGLAVNGRGELLVADANNHCLRLVRDGIVSTFAGRCGSGGSADGSAASATFLRPMALALDSSNGDAYVADFGVGLRKVDAAGTVTTPFPNLRNKLVTGVALYGDSLLVADTEGYSFLNVRGGEEVRYVDGAPASPFATNTIAGFEYAGFPHSVVALSSQDFVVTDVHMHSVRYLHWDRSWGEHSRVIAGGHDVDALIRGGGYVDGDGAAARFNVPLGLALSPAGTILVADGGNHVLRVLSDFDRELGVVRDRATTGARPNAYRVALIGCPSTCRLTEASSSIQDAIRRRLADEPAFRRTGLDVAVETFPVQANDLAALSASAGEVLSRERFDTVVLEVSTTQVPSTANPAALASITQFRKSLEASGASLLIALNPQPGELAPWESYASFLAFPNGASPAPGFSGTPKTAALALAASGAATLDITAPMLADEFRPRHEPLYGTMDSHFSPYGRAFVGNLIGTELLRRRDWAGAAKRARGETRTVAPPQHDLPPRRAAGVVGTARHADDDEPALVGSDVPPANPPVTTMHVSGANFAMPSGLAYDGAGRLYVADAAHQVIFSVDPAGRASIFAGSATPGTMLAEGGYADGPAGAARFDRPMGLAVDAHGALLVADAGNHCVRRIYAEVVSTLAGRCTVAGRRDGPAASALFERPLALQIDPSNGDLYIADFGGGLRKLDVRGVVTTPFPDLPNTRVTGVSLGGGYNLLVVDTDGITLRDLPNSTPIRYFSGSPANDSLPDSFMSHEFGGFPYSAAALGPRQFVVSDVRMHDIRFVNWQRSRVIAGSRDVDANLRGGGYSDGPGDAARFNVPLAVAVAPNGSVVVADAGNHVLRVLGDFDRAWMNRSGSALEDFHFKRDEYRVALVGNSAVWWSSDTPTSTQAWIERRLAVEPAFRAAGLHPRVVTFGLGAPSLDATVSVLREIIALEHFDTIVLELNEAQLRGNQIGVAHRDESAWKPSLLADLAEIRKELAEDKVSLLVATGPIFLEFAPWEAYAGLLDGGNGNANTIDWGKSPAALAAAVASSGVPMLDMNAPMLVDEFRPAHRPLFMALDGHYSAYGRELVGKLIAAELLHRRYWEVAKKR